MKDKIWGFTAGLLLAAGVFGHALRLVILADGEYWFTALCSWVRCFVIFGDCNFGFCKK
ncbi:MAG: hypothetical protein IPQ19_11210 [Bacteroidetes bacterium]|nr:hypothetical protein [Bacteroidota bacterium]